MATTMRIRGLPELQRKLTPQLVAGPSRRFFVRSVSVIETRAKANAPVWQAHLKNSIDQEIDGGMVPRWGRVGTNAESGPWMELGTRPHFPPYKGESGVGPWARAHGIEPFVLARSISRKGTKPHPFLVPALEASKGDIRAFVTLMASEIEAQGGGG